MNVAVLACIPVISALIGWLTNLLAVKMIFRPRKQITFMGIKIEGLIPKRKSDLARKIGETVENELISHKDIKQAINNPKFHEEVSTIVRKKVEDFFSEKLAANPLVAMFLSGDIAITIRESLVTEIEKMIPHTMDLLFEKMEKKLDFKKIVTEKIEQFELLKLEKIIYAIAAKELKAIELLGGILGFVVGLVQIGIILAGKLYV